MGLSDLEVALEPALMPTPWLCGEADESRENRHVKSHSAERLSSLEFCEHYAVNPLASNDIYINIYILYI